MKETRALTISDLWEFSVKFYKNTEINKWVKPFLFIFVLPVTLVVLKIKYRRKI